MECPVIDCAQAEEALQALAEMEAYLEAMGYSLGLAGDDAMRHFESIVETNVGTGESAAALPGGDSMKAWEGNGHGRRRDAFRPGRVRRRARPAVGRRATHCA